MEYHLATIELEEIVNVARVLVTNVDLFLMEIKARPR